MATLSSLPDLPRSAVPRRVLASLARDPAGAQPLAGMGLRAGAGPGAEGPKRPLPAPPEEGGPRHGDVAAAP